MFKIDMPGDFILRPRPKDGLSSLINQDSHLRYWCIEVISATLKRNFSLWYRIVRTQR
jgi:hypothetical protein